MSGSRLPLALQEYMDFVRHVSGFGPLVLAKDMAELLGIVGQEKVFEEIHAFAERTGWRFTLFFTARHLGKHRSWVERFIEQGHEIGSHSYSHRLFPTMDDETLREEFISAEDAFSELGLKPLGLRMPFLASDQRVPPMAKEFGFSYLSNQHGGEPSIHSSGVWEFPVRKPYDWYGRAVLRMSPRDIGRAWERQDGMVTLVHPRYFAEMEPIILEHHGGYKKDKRICSSLRETGRGFRRWDDALSFDIY